MLFCDMGASTLQYKDDIFEVKALSMDFFRNSMSPVLSFFHRLIPLICSSLSLMTA